MESEWARLQLSIERRRLAPILGLFLVVAAASFYFAASLNQVRLLTITDAPSFVPTWVGEYYEAVGATEILLLVFGGLTFFQMGRWARAKAHLERLHGAPAQSTAGGLPPPPPDWESAGAR